MADHAWLDSLSEDWPSQLLPEESPSIKLEELEAELEPKTNDSDDEHNDSLGSINADHKSSRSKPTSHDRIPVPLVDLQAAFHESRFAPPSAEPSGANSNHNSNSNSCASISSNPNPNTNRNSLPSVASRSRANGPDVSLDTIGSDANSVVHNTVNISQAPTNVQTPEWKRRLLKGELGYGEQRDLFHSAAAEGLENIFKPPSTDTATESEIRQSIEFDDSRDPQFRHEMTLPSSPPVCSIRRPAVSKEFEDSLASDYMDNSPSPSPRKLPVYRMNDDSQCFSDASALQHLDPKPTKPKYLSPDSYLNDARKSSNVSVAQNETFSPIIVSPLKGKDGQLEIEFTPIPGPAFDSTNQQPQILSLNPPASGSHRTESGMFDSTPHDSFTSSTGQEQRNNMFGSTQRSMQHGSQSDEGSFRQGSLSPGMGMEDSEMLPEESLQASTPKMYSLATNDSQSEMPSAEAIRERLRLDPVVGDNFQLDGSTSPQRSPLKLFGPYDTFTNQVLVRRISQLEHDMASPVHETFPNSYKGNRIFDNASDDDDLDDLNAGIDRIDIDIDPDEEKKKTKERPSTPASLQSRNQPRESQNKRPMKINNFGRGDLEGFTFDETSMSPSGTPESAGKFQIPRISIDGLCVPRSRVRGHTRGRSLNDNPVGSFNPDSIVSTPRKDRSRDGSQEGKRSRPSPCKDPTPKRRRTLHKSDVAYGMDELLNQARSSHMLLKPGAAARMMLPPPVYRKIEQYPAAPMTPPTPSPAQRNTPHKLRMLDREFRDEDDEVDDNEEAEQQEASTEHGGEEEGQLEGHSGQLREEYSGEHQEEHLGEHYEEHYDENYGEHYDENHDEQYDEQYEGQYDEHYDEHYEEEYDGQYEEQYDEQDDGQYHEHHDGQYDENYNEHYDEQHDEQHDEHHDEHYDDQYGQHFDGDYGEGEEGQHFDQGEGHHQEEVDEHWPSGSRSHSPQYDPRDPRDSARFSTSPSPVGTPYRATSLQSNQVSDRKPSIKTQDFLDEAGKIMAFIRRQVQPSTVLDPVSENITEPGEEVADDDSYQSSSREPFDRPPSRENSLPVARRFTQQQRDPEIEKRLRKYRERGSDANDVISTSVNSASQAPTAVKENKEPKDTVKTKTDEQPTRASLLLSRSRTDDPPEERKFRPALRKKENGRYTFVDMLADGSFSDSAEMQLARNPEPSANRVIFGAPRSGDEFASVGSRNSLSNTASSRASESKKTIAPESVLHLIPDQVGNMFLDREKKTWVKRKDSNSISGSQRSQTSLVSPTQEQAPQLARPQSPTKKPSQAQTRSPEQPKSVVESQPASLQRKPSGFRPPPSATEYGQSIASQPPTERTINMLPSDDSEDDPFASIPDLSVDLASEMRNLQLGARKLAGDQEQRFVEGNSFPSNMLVVPKGSKGFVTFSPNTAVDAGMSPRAIKELTKLGSRPAVDTEKPVRSLFSNASALVQALVRKPSTASAATVATTAGKQDTLPASKPASPTEPKTPGPSPAPDKKQDALPTPSSRANAPPRASDSPSSIPKPILSNSVKKRNAISFSSPIASVIRDLSGGSEEDPRWNLPSAPSNGDSPSGNTSGSIGRPALKPSLRKYISSNVPAAIRRSSVTRLSFVPRPVSRIDEEDSSAHGSGSALKQASEGGNNVEEGLNGGDVSGKVRQSIERDKTSSNDPDSPNNLDDQMMTEDEEEFDDDDMQLTILDNSLVEVSAGLEAQRTNGNMGYVFTTPANKGEQHQGQSDSATIARHVGRMSLSPLSEFTIHAADESYALEVSYVVGNQHLQTGDGTRRAMPITVRDLVERLTDAEPSVSFWDDLEELELNDNRLISLHMLDEFCGNLVKLDASDNALTHLEGVPSSLRQLKIVHNSITEMASWDHLVNLQYLDLSNNDLKSLSALRNLVHLRSIRVDNNHLTSLDGLGHHDAILSIRARGNNIRELDFNNCAFERLEELDVSQNKIESVANVDVLPVLSILKLQNNRLKEFHIDSKVPVLRVLELSDNDLATIDLRNLSGLRVLHADRNRIVEISSSHLARHLDSLSLREQRGSEHLNLSFLSHAYEVRKLFLSGNHIADFDPPVDFLNLQLLELANCGLRSLPRHLGQCMPNLRTVNINFNALKDLSPLLFIPRIKRLLAAGNRLSDATMVTKLLTEFPHMTRLDLRDNPMTLGFYPPAMHVLSLSHGDAPDPFTLPNVLDASRDRAFAARLDTLTRMRRRLYQMVLVGCCARLKVLDGLEFKRSEVMGRDMISEELVREGIVPAEMVKWRLDDDNNEMRGITETGGPEGRRRRRASSRWSVGDSYA